MGDSCTEETYRADLNGPAEYCEGDTVPGTDKCEKHQDYNMEPDPDAARDDAREAAAEGADFAARRRGFGWVD